MTMSVTLGVLFSVVSLNCLVTGDPLTVLTFTSAKATTIPCDYFDPWTVTVTPTKKSSLLSVTIPVKKEIPPTMNMKLTVKLSGQDPFDYTISVCEALSDPAIGASFVRAGLPKDTFPKSCPFIPGDWSILKWDPPVLNIPPGTPDGPVTGSVTIEEEGQPPYVTIDYVGELSHPVPGFGR